MDYETFVIVVKAADEEQEIELNLTSTPPSGRAIELGLAVERMLDASGRGDQTVTVSRYAF